MKTYSFKAASMAAVFCIAAAACQSGEGVAANEGATQKKKTSTKPSPPPKAAPRPAPIQPQPFMPPEWLETAKRGGASIEDLQSVAIYLYQNPSDIARPEMAAFVAAAYSCNDANLANRNEIERPAVFAKYGNRLRQFYGTAIPTGITGTLAVLNSYDATKGAFPWANAVDGSLRVQQVKSEQNPRVGCTTTLYQWPFRFTLRFSNLVIPPVAMTREAASAFINEMPDRTMQIDIRLRVEKVSGGPPENAKMFGSYANALLPVTMTSASITRSASNKVVATVGK